MSELLAPVDFSTLNSEQQRAVQQIDGRLLILAGAGSGKTRVLTYRIAYLLSHCNVEPESILGLTFTNKAAAEMRHRLAGMVGQKLAKRVILSTFHSFCLRILRKEIHRLGFTSQFTLYDEEDIRRLTTSIARQLLDHESQLPSISTAMAAITRARSASTSVDGLEEDESEWHGEFTRKLYQGLEAALRAYNAVDFDGLLGLTVKLFQEHQDVLSAYQERYQYIMVDEYQDTSPIQYQLVDLISKHHGNLCVVGDDDQSIYGWRGADVRNILEFEKATVVKLEQNYRSANGILKAANAVIGNNSERHGKSLWSAKGEGDPIEIFHAPTEANEAHSVVCRINKLREQKGLKWKDIAILYRSNALSRQMEMALMKFTWRRGNDWVKGVPYQIFGGLSFYERKEVKDIVGYLRVIVNPLDQQALLRTINQPRRGIGETALDRLTSVNRSKNEPLWHVLQAASQGETSYQGNSIEVASRAAGGVKDYVQLIEEAQHKFKEEPLPEAMKWLLDRIQYQKAIAEEVKSEKMRAIKWENVQELVSAAAEYEMSEELDHTASLEDFMVTTSLGEDNNFKRNELKEQNNHVSLMTFHSAKGLEFPACFLVGLEDHIIPHERSLKEGSLEEERRLMYVGMTRAMQHLTCSMAQQRLRMGKPMAGKPSRFLFEIPKDLMQVTSWDRI